MERSDAVKKGQRVICLKIGGRAAADDSSMNELVAEIRELSNDTRFIVVHGGGAEVTRLSERLGFTPTFEDGVRMTSPGEMDVVDMVLSGTMNKTLVRRFAAAGVRAAGVSGSDGALFTGTPLNDSTRTAKIDRVDCTMLELLVDGGFLPIVASTSMTGAGVALNVNADEAAFAIAAALPADLLVFLSDIPGILAADGSVIPLLDERSVAEHIADKTITGGMIPKVRASVDALRAGTGGIVVGKFSSSGDLRRLLDGGIGSRVVLSEHADRRSR